MPTNFRKLFVLLCILIAANTTVAAQGTRDTPADTLHFTIHSWRQAAAPTLMAAYGIAAPGIGLLRQVNQNTSRHFAPTAFRRANWDSYLRWAPATGILALKAAGMRTNHTLRQQLMLQASAHLLTAGTVWSGKKIFHRERPDGSGNNSFPSGHSAVAFTGATIWRLELKKTHPVLSWGGYLLAGITAAQRVRHNEHWVSDVVGGAGVGILSAQASYWILERYRAGRMNKQLPGFFWFDKANGKKPRSHIGRE